MAAPIPFATIQYKINNDCDLSDADWIDNPDLINFINEAIADAEGEIHELGIQEQYFRAYDFPAITAAQTKLLLPSDCYGFKVGKQFYSDGTRVYEIKPFKSLEEYTNNQVMDDLRFVLANTLADGPHMLFGPAFPVTIANVPASPSTVGFTRYYIRHVKKVDGLGGPNDVLEIPEAESYIYARVKTFIAQKEGRPDLKTFTDKEEDAYTKMMQKLANIRVDENTMIPLDASFYQDVIGYYPGGF